MSKCPQCGAEVSGKFCSECGAKMQVKNTCPNCGTEVSGKFCPECGTKIQAEAQIFPMDDFDISLTDLHQLSQNQLSEQNQSTQKSADYNQKVTKARTLCIRGMFDEAQAIYEEMIDNDPMDMNGFMGLLRVASQNYTIVDDKNVQTAERIALEICGGEDLCKFDKDYKKFEQEKMNEKIRARKRQEEQKRLEEERLAREERERRRLEEMLAQKKEEERLRREREEAELAKKRREEEDVATMQSECARALKLYYDNHFKQAFPVFLKYAAMATPEVKRALGYCYHTANGTQKNNEEAFKWYSLAAEGGDAPAMYNLALMTQNGTATKKSEKVAIEWYTKSANLGYVKSMKALGNRYLIGNGVTKNLAESEKWFEKAAETGDLEAINHLSHYYAFAIYGNTANQKKAFAWYKKAADLGDVSAQYEVGRRYHLYADEGGTAKNPATGNKYLRMAAESGNSHAMCDLGYSYDAGRGIDVNKYTAVSWYEKGAKAGSAQAMFNLAWCYEHGEGCTKSLNSAITWYQKAAEKNHEKAKNALKRLGR